MATPAAAPPAALGNIPDANRATVLTSVFVLATIVGLKFVSEKIPGALIAVVGAIAVSWGADLASHGVSDLGKVPGGLPDVSWPGVPFSDIGQLVATAISIFVVILAQSAATSRAYAARYQERFDENVDMVGLGMANIGAGFTGAFVVNGSPTKTQIANSAGGRTQLTSLTTAGVVLVVLLFLTKPLQYLPNCVLASVVFLIGVELVDIAGLRKVFRSGHQLEFWIAAVTAATVVGWGVEQGIILAIVLSIVLHLRHGYSPQIETTEPKPGLVVFRWGASLYFANAARFEEALTSLAGSPRWLCVDAVAIGDVDYTGGETLVQVADELRKRDVRLVVAEVAPAVRTELDQAGVTAVLGEDAFYASLDEVVAAYGAQ